jgi:histidine ammonia-lyase
MSTEHHLSLEFYSIDLLREIVETKPRLNLSPEVEARIEAGASFVQRKSQEDRYIYGVNTGFGALCETRIRADEVETLQYNHVVSHACGVGPLVEERICRYVMLVKLLTFRHGNTGISLDVVRRMLDFWNHDVIPVVPKKGTVGASGDLAPLAHLALPLLGMGQVYDRGVLADSMDVLNAKGWQPIRLKAKEGLALTNGVQYINGVGASYLVEIEELVRAADLIAAMSVQAFSASWTFYQAPYHETSYHPERRTIAANLRKLLDGSNHFELPTTNRSLQDPYSFRCLPQVHAAVRQAVGHARTIIERECNSVSDNPLFFPDLDLILFGGNLHGESTALYLDFLAIAVSELANISERRGYQLLSGQRGLPDFLVRKPGVNSGYMIVQYTAAALVNENKVLSTPASVDTIPTSQLQEDHVSMGGTSSYKLGEIIRNCEYILAIELMMAAQAVELNQGLRLSPATQGVYESLRARIRPLDEDRFMAPDIEAARDFVRENRRAWIRSLGIE